ncbi:MAG: ATP-binding protein [Clostridia bacterium]|nr:ATP-binding protein [Clostridia bacterium]
MSEAFTERISGEKCPECGEFIRYGYIAAMKQEFPIACSCQTEKQAKQREQTIAKGKENIRNSMRVLSGLKSRQRGFFFGRITPRAGQEKAYKAAVDFIQRYSKDRHTAGLMFCGSVGSGKTLLSAAVANAVIDMYPIEDDEAQRVGETAEHAAYYTPVRFTSSVELLEQIRALFNKNGGEESSQVIINRLKKAPLLILDDLGAEKPSEWANERIFEIVDHRYNESLPVIVTTNATPGELKNQIGERSFDRLREMCELVPLAAKSQRKTAGA